MPKITYIQTIVLFLLLLFLWAVPNNVVFANGNCDGGGAQCGYSGSGGSTQKATAVTVSSTSGGGSGGGGGGGKSSSNGLSNNTASSSSSGYYGRVGNTNICYHATDAGGVDHIGNCGFKTKHTGGGGSTTTVTVFYICDNVIVSSADITCGHTTQWQLTARATWPGIPIDVRPYPATVNRWPTVLRVDSLPTSTGSASLPYASMGGGSPTNPAGGDWRNLTVTVTIYPDPGVLPQVYLQNIGWIIPPVGELYTFQWPLPSHPAAGGGPTAGAVGQLEELPQDMPLYTNQARAAYLVSCELDYQEYDNVCVLGVDASGNTNCDNNQGHNVSEWVNKSMVQNLPVTKSSVPASMMADTNGDGIPDAYWDPGVVINRMNDSDSVSDPVYGHSYSWGDIFYWGVREAQGQITYP